MADFAKPNTGCFCISPGKIEIVFHMDAVQ
jgi:hypothetical protein